MNNSVLPIQFEITFVDHTKWVQNFANYVFFKN